MVRRSSRLGIWYCDLRIRHWGSRLLRPNPEVKYVYRLPVVPPSPCNHCLVFDGDNESIDPTVLDDGLTGRERIIEGCGDDETPRVLDHDCGRLFDVLWILYPFEPDAL